MTKETRKARRGARGCCEAPVQMELYRVAAEDPNVGWLEKYLEATAEWLSAGQLAVIAGRGDGEQGRRWVRALAEGSEWVISGQKGYKHLEHATAEEIGHFVNWMESQARRMIARAERIRRNGHRVVG